MAFTLKGAFSKVSAGLETAWTDLKTGAGAVATFITNEGATITKDTGSIGAVVTAAIPSASGVVTAIEALESKVMAIVLAGSTELAGATAGNAVQTVTALKALLPQIQAAADTLSTHPAVVAANTTTA